MSEDRTMVLSIRDGKLDKGIYGESFSSSRTKNLWLTVVSRDNYSVTVRLPDDFDRLPNIFVEDRKKRGFNKKKKPIVRALEGKPIHPKKSWLRKFNGTKPAINKPVTNVQPTNVTNPTPPAANG